MAYGNNSSLIGSGIDPRMFVQDFGGIASAAAMESQGMANGIQSAVSGIAGGVGDYLKAQKDDKAKLKTGAAMIDAAAKMFPSQSDALSGYAQQLKDENVPLNQRAAMADQIAGLINMSVGEGRHQEDMKMRQQGQEIDRMQAISSINATNTATNKSIEDAARISEVAEANTPVLLEMLKSQNQRTGILTPQAIERYAQIKDPRASSEAIMGALKLTAPDKTEFSDVKDFKVGGQIIQGRMNLRSGVIQPAMMPTEGFDPSGLPAPLQPHAQTFVNAGAKYGVDPKVLAAIAIHETGNGTSAAFRQKHNAMGVSDANGPIDTGSVDASVDRMAGLLAAGMRGEGPYAGKTTIGDIASVYAPVGAGNDPRGLNKDWTSGVGSALKRLGGDPNSPIAMRSSVPAVSSADTISPKDAQDMRFQKEDHDTKLAEAASTKQKAEAEKKRVLDTIDKYMYPDGKPKQDLVDAVGFGEGVGSWLGQVPFLPGNQPKTRANQQDLQRNLVEASLLEASKALKPVSNDELKLLQSNRPSKTDHEDIWTQYMLDLKRILGDPSNYVGAPDSPEQLRQNEQRQLNDKIAAQQAKSAGTQASR